MSTSHYWMQVGGLSVEVVRKAIKNLHIGVYPPEGRVRVAAPLLLPDTALRAAIVTRLRWIRQQQSRFAAQVRQSEREMVSGETHYFQGRRYRLRVVEGGRSGVRISGGATLELCAPPGADVRRRREILAQWYRQRLQDALPPLVAQWERRVGARVNEVRIKRMKTLWGSCNADARRIWLNLELAKKPPVCLEYILVHEMVHLLERHHNARFMALMDSLMPNWRMVRDVLNRAPLAHEAWDY